MLWMFVLNFLCSNLFTAKFISHNVSANKTDSREIHVLTGTFEQNQNEPSQFKAKKWCTENQV